MIGKTVLELIEIHKSYENRPLLRGISLKVEPGETICLLGPSGSGKSTLLRIIAGLDDFEAGRVLWEGSDLAAVPAHLRRFGLVFQDYALFPHKTVGENVSFGLEMQDLPAAEIDRRVAGALEQVRMAAFRGRRVTDLSGGEQQRVALARALAPQPTLLMFDEPLGALDRTLREELLDELRSILREAGVPAIYVTHDQEEAFTIAERILLLHEGQIVQSGTPVEVSRNPANGWTARFLGLGNVLEGEFVPARPPRLRTAAGELPLACSHTHDEGDRLEGLLRPLALGMGAGQDQTGGLLSGTVADVVFRQDHFRVTLESGMTFHLERAPHLGERVTLQVPPVECLGASP
jgi:ABC-type Fe3+/spermidine/putrescine transport system ATPase subunit